MLLVPVGEPVDQGVQHRDPSIAYQRHVAAGNRGRLRRHSVVEGQLAQIAEYVDRPRGVDYKIGRAVEYHLGSLIQSSRPWVVASESDQTTSSV